MKGYVVLIITGLVTAFVTGYFALSLQWTSNPSSSDIIKTETIKRNFFKGARPISIINFSAIYFTKDKQQLLDPIYTLSQISNLSDELLFATDRECYKHVGFFATTLSYYKNVLWEEFRCGKRRVLPKNFFLSSPLMHPSGKSFAYLAFSSGKKEFSGNKWIKSYLPYFHALELNAVKKQLGALDGFYDILEELTPNTLSLLKNSDLYARTPNSSLFTKPISTPTSKNLFV